MLSTEFVYCPKSGDRWIGDAGPREGAEVLLVEWHNGSAHIVMTERQAGLDTDGVATLFFFAAEPGRYWRDEACRMAEEIALRTGGYAWDDRGEVCLAVPARYGVMATAAMWLARGRATRWHPDPEVRGVLHVRLDEDTWEDLLTLARTAQSAGALISALGGLLLSGLTPGPQPTPRPWVWDHGYRYDGFGEAQTRRTEITFLQTGDDGIGGGTGGRVVAADWQVQRVCGAEPGESAEGEATVFGAAEAAVKERAG